jgi:hypothetical protein
VGEALAEDFLMTRLRATVEEIIREYGGQHLRVGMFGS